MKTVPGTRGSLNDLMSIATMWIICNGLWSSQFSTQLNTYGRFWSNMLDSALYHFYPKTNERLSFGWMVFIPRLEIRELENLCRSVRLFSRLVVNKTLHVGFFLTYIFNTHLYWRKSCKAYSLKQIIGTCIMCSHNNTFAQHSNYKDLHIMLWKSPPVQTQISTNMLL